MKHRRCTFFQALCQGPEGRSLNSFGRRRRRRRETFRQGRELNEDISLREMFRVYETREEIPAKLSVNKIGGTSSPKVGPQVCLNSTEYYGLVTTFLVNIFSYPLSQIESTVKAHPCWIWKTRFLTIKGSFIRVFWKRLSNRKKDYRGALLQKRTQIE